MSHKTGPPANKNQFLRFSTTTSKTVDTDGASTTPTGRTDRSGSGQSGQSGMTASTSTTSVDSVATSMINFSLTSVQSPTSGGGGGGGAGGSGGGNSSQGTPTSMDRQERMERMSRIATLENASPTSSEAGISLGISTSSGGFYDQYGHGHYFSKKTFHKPTYCHHCTDMLWGLIGQGFICEVCNFVVHERCLKTVVSPCSTVASNVIKNPVPHCWTDSGHFKRKFCNVCRKRITEDQSAVRCEVCEYCVHSECHDFSVPDCKECATFVPEQELREVCQTHHWREGNLPANSKCHYCKKTCWSTECLAGMRCEWCGITAHAACYKHLSSECQFGWLQSIMLPPFCVSIPRIDVPLETIIGVQNKKDKEKIKAEATTPRVMSDDFTMNELRNKDADDYASPKDRDRDEETIKVYDGNVSMKRKAFRNITISRNATKDQIVAACLRAFNIYDDPKSYIITDAYATPERELSDFMPVQSLIRLDGSKRCGLFFRYKPPNPDEGAIRVYPGRLNVTDTYRVIRVTIDTSVAEVMVQALDEFGLASSDLNRYRLVEVSLEKGSVHERTMDNNECPWAIVRGIARESIRQKENTRFYLQQIDQVYCSNVAIFVGNLPPNLPEKHYETMVMEPLGKPYKFRQIGPIYYEYGSLIITYDNADIAVKAYYRLREHSVEDKQLLVLLLPNIMPEMIPKGVRPLLVFVNVKSGGCQGLELISSFRKLLNPYQVYDLENGGPLPGLYVCRHIKDYKILVCGGDGTVGWVLQCLDNVGQDSECQSPPCGIVPLGTGNDLARVLRWGPGYTGQEDPITVLKDVIEAEEIILDRWTVMIHTGEGGRPATLEQLPMALVWDRQGNPGNIGDDTLVLVMNNYFGVGIDADLCLGFHNAREENPERFNSRLHNKGVYVKMGLKKMVSRKSWRDLHKEIKLEVDGKSVNLPPVEGIIVLNILSWGSGANPWGPEKDDQFTKPNHYDGMLEVVGVNGVVHMGQIQSGLRTAMRIAQGGHIRITLRTEMPIQVDGEPWIQAPGEVVLLKSALKATMLRKSKMRRRNTEPSLQGEQGAAAGGSGQSSSGDSGRRRVIGADDRDKDKLTEAE